MIQRILIALCLIVFLSSQLDAGVVYEIETTDHEQSPPKVSETEMAAEGHSLKMSIPAGEHGRSGDMIFRGDRREIVVVDHEDQSYHVMDEEMIEQVAGQVGQVSSQIAEALKNVPADQRAMVEKMMKQRMPVQAEPLELPKAEVRRTDERATKNGYPCVKYIVLLDGRKLRELWVTDWDNLAGGDEARAVFHELAGCFAEMMEAMEKAAGGLGAMGDFASQSDSAFADIKEIDGFPVVTSGFGEDGSLENESVLRSARRRTLDPDAFEPPSGYKRRTMLGQ